MLDNRFLQAVVDLIGDWGRLLVALWKTGRKELCLTVAKEINIAITECRLK